MTTLLSKPPPELDTLAVDPGSDKSGVAWGGARELQHCDHVVTPSFGFGWASPLKLVIEMPGVHDGFTRNPGDVLKVRDAATYWRGFARWREVRELAPVQWKGSLNKPQSHRGIWKVLTPRERLIVARAVGLPCDQLQAKIEAACMQFCRTGKVKNYSFAGHNVIDAVGILLREYGRN